MSKRVLVKVSKDGTKMTAEVEGVQGTSCTDLTNALVNRAGLVENQEETDEMYLDQEVERENI